MRQSVEIHGRVIFGAELRLARQRLHDTQDVKKDTNLASGMCRHDVFFKNEWALSIYRGKIEGSQLCHCYRACIYGSYHLIKQFNAYFQKNHRNDRNRSLSRIKFVFVIGNPKFVWNLKLRAASPATRKPSEWRHEIRRVYFKKIVMKILGRLRAW